MSSNTTNTARSSISQKSLVTSSIFCLLLGLLTALQASAAIPAFELKNTGSSMAERDEVFYFNGGGTFDLSAETVQGEGTFFIDNTDDEGFEFMSGTWVATDLLSFTSVKGQQILRILVTLNFDLGFSIPGIEVIIAKRAALVPDLVGEAFIVPVSGHAVFHMTGQKP